MWKKSKIENNSVHQLSFTYTFTKFSKGRITNGGNEWNAHNTVFGSKGSAISNT